MTVSNFRLRRVRCSASSTRKCTVSSRVSSFSCAFRIASGAESIPHTSYPFSAKKRACSPVPHPMSRTDPLISPRCTSSTNSLWGQPMSQGGVPWYAVSKKSVHQVAPDRIIIISVLDESSTKIRRIAGYPYRITRLPGKKVRAPVSR